MNHKIQINIADEDIEVIESILDAYRTNNKDRNTVLGLVCKFNVEMLWVILGILKQIWYKLQEIKG